MIKYFLIVFILLFVWSFFIEPNLLIVKNYTFKEFGDKKIVFVSDFHIAKNDIARLRKIVNTINEIEPDLVLSGGDFIKGHDGKNTLPIEEQVKEFKRINVPIITVLGNHDGWYNKELVRETLQKNGITVLENSNTKFEGISIAGVEDIQTGFPDVELALIGVESPTILLSHSPDIYYDVHEKVDLILAGHLHGGQIYLPFIGALTVPSKYGNRFVRGLIKETNNKMLVTNGLGTSILPIRFGSIPEIVVISGEEEN